VLEVFIERGDQLSMSRKLMADSPEYSSALALVSIHCAIAFSDALLVKFTGHHEPRKNHMSAVGKVRKQCSSRHLSARGVAHLEELLRAKTKVSYSKERTPYELASRLAIASERFEAWARPLMNQ
jgi:hypothetical protein